MKSYAQLATILALATLSNACILDTVSDPDAEQVRLSIGSWNVDVNNVNNFLNNAPNLIANNDLSDLLSQVPGVLNNAEDEPCQLMTLGSQSQLMGLIPAFDCAVGDLMNVFMVHVINNLVTINGTTDVPTIQNAIDDINNFRCCHVLPDVDILFLNSAEQNGLVGEVPTSVNRENACSSITCSGDLVDVCTTESGATGKRATRKRATGRRSIGK